MKELTINIARDFSRYIGGRERRIADFSGEEFRERFLDDNFEKYDRITVELDGTLGYPIEFLEETFGVMASRYGAEAFWKKFNLVARNEFYLEKIAYIVNHSEKEA